MRVVDYKTGRKSFDLSDVRYGLGIQMLLYLFTLEKEGSPASDTPSFRRGAVPPGTGSDPEGRPGHFTGGPPQGHGPGAAAGRHGAGDPEVLRAMEHSALEAPCFLPIQVSKDGGISGGVATAAQLGRLGQYVEKLLHQIIRELRQGNIDADPCWRGPQESACTYCDFASACHFQDGQAGDRLRPLKRVKPDEFWEFVAHEMGEEGRHGSFEPTPEQRRAMEDRGGSLLVSAAAGSGKTKVLVERLFGYMERERCRIDDFLIITFTKAAAAELRAGSPQS